MKKNITIVLNSFCKETLKSYSYYLTDILHKKSLLVSTYKNPVIKKRFSFLKSPHVFKKAKDHYQYFIHNSTLFISGVSPIALKQILFSLKNRPKTLTITIKSAITPGCSLRRVV